MSDQYRISPYNTKTTLSEQVMRIKKNIHERLSVDPIPHSQSNKGFLSFCANCKLSTWKVHEVNAMYTKCSVDRAPLKVPRKFSAVLYHKSRKENTFLKFYLIQRVSKACSLYLATFIGPVFKMKTNTCLWNQTAAIVILPILVDFSSFLQCVLKYFGT